MSKKKIKFQYKSLKIESAYIFEDGDFIIFPSGESKDVSDKNISTLFDGITLKSKLILKISSGHCFFDLKDNEFGLCINYDFRIYKFYNERTEYKEIQSLKLQQFGTGRKLMRLLNGDILFFKFNMRGQSFSVFRKTKDELENNGKEDIYKLQNQYHIENCEEIIELNKNEILVYKKNISTPETLNLMIYNSNNYQLIRKNNIIAEIKDSNNNIQKKLYFNTELLKYNDEKLIAGGLFNFYIIDLKHLELETTIKLDKTIDQILIRPKGNILATFSRKEENQTRQYFMSNIKIDFQTNDLIKNKETDITDKIGNYSSFFKFYNYLNNGLVINTDSELIIYEDYGDYKDIEEESFLYNLVVNNSAVHFFNKIFK